MQIDFIQNNKLKISVNIPDQWSQLNKKQLLKLADITNNIDLGSSSFKNNILLTFFLFLTNIKVVNINTIFYKPNLRFKDSQLFLVKHKNKTMLISNHDLNFGAQKLNWLFDNDNISPKLTSLPHLNKIIKPAELLTNLTFIQYIHADSHFQAFLQSKDINYLDKFITAICVKDFNDKTYLDNINKYSKLHINIKTIIIWYYIGSRLVIAKIYKNLFAKIAKPDKDKQSSDVFLQYMSLVSNICKSASEISTIENQNAWKIFDYLENLIIKNNKKP